jgi:hypothetical protein
MAGQAERRIDPEDDARQRADGEILLGQHFNLGARSGDRTGGAMQMWRPSESVAAQGGAIVTRERAALPHCQ